MSKIQHMEMGATIMALNEIKVKKGFLGLSTKLFYLPTNSAIKMKEKEYSAEDGRRLETILSTEPENMEEAIRKNPVTAINMGNVKLEACISDDCQFAAVQLLSFKDFDYTPLSDVKIYTGKTAETVASLF